MGAQLTVENNGSVPVRADLYAKTGQLLESAHIPEDHAWAPSTKKLVAMMPYDLVVVDDTGLRWRLGFTAPRGGAAQKKNIMVSEVEDGEFLAPVKPPRFPSKLDAGVRLVKNPKRAQRRVGDHDAYEVVVQEEREDAKSSIALDDAAAFEASRIQTLRVIEENYTNVQLEGSSEPLDSEHLQESVDFKDAISLDEPSSSESKGDSKSPFDSKSEYPDKMKMLSPGTKASAVVVGGIVGAALGGPIGYYLGGTAVVAYPVAGLICGIFTGAAGASCTSCRRSEAKPILPE
mmetsp:Transcript_73/g.161  ORF Transcript_73/g.161 Transcript_73/m.161 type:complete len:290 (-) Transcript_73:214-1083(-)|eukprot:CAMPEP_0114523040 /NCGR_PEP_ID=MMETSP0109-20121206/21075_1 /TAXON_ID=29199 /ORGANISM="Chlorarachnion reptans, Strain CCCM449" /LENGTH=289 /DNA_ID=CAMNT_0001704321 /DNA_START=350 /DNA_END=1219 /DNA_ORIENTATION=-